MFLKFSKSKFSIKAAIFVVTLISISIFTHNLLFSTFEKCVLTADKILLSPNGVRSGDNTKFVLLWKNHHVFTQGYIRTLNCPISDCVFTENKNLLDGDYSQFDAIIFHEDLLTDKWLMPTKRKSHQLYTFFTIESSYHNPACELRNDNYYNLTFTYKLDSDIPWTYFIVRDVNGDIVAPSLIVRWEESIKPIKPAIKSILKRKTKAIAWLVSHCSADSFRDDYLSRLQEHLYHYSLKIDVFGGCNGLKCFNKDCNEMLRNNYYFYAAFENSFSEDYVTEKVLHGYLNYAVPIVYGASNYSRFLPPNSYINAREFHPYNLAYKIYEAMRDYEIFESYFKWTNTYTISDHQDMDHPLCNLCGHLHSYKARRAPAKKSFRVWWNGLNGMKWCLSPEYWNETARLNIDANHIFTMY